MIKMIKMIKMSGFPNSGWGGGWVITESRGVGRHVGSVTRHWIQTGPVHRNVGTCRCFPAVDHRRSGVNPPLSVFLACNPRFRPGDGFFIRGQNDRHVLTFRSRWNRTRTAFSRMLKMIKMIFGLVPCVFYGFGVSTGVKRPISPYGLAWCLTGVKND